MKTIRETCGWWVVLLAVLWSQALSDALPLRAQSSVQDRARLVLPAELLQELEALVEASQSDGVPAELLYTKAVEGVAKGARPSQILPVVAAYADQIREARLALGPDVPRSILVAGVDAVVRGVPPESLSRLAPAERTAMALVVLADLVESGVPAEDALGVVREAMTRRTDDEEMLSITSAVKTLIRDGRPARAAADAIRRAIRDGRPIHDLPSIGGDGLRVPAPPGSEPVTRDRRRSGGGVVPFGDF